MCQSMKLDIQYSTQLPQLSFRVGPGDIEADFWLFC